MAGSTKALNHKAVMGWLDKSKELSLVQGPPQTSPTSKLKRALLFAVGMLL